MVDYSKIADAQPENIPNSAILTPDGETLYYKITKILKVLDDALAGNIPALQDLKESAGNTSGTAAPALHANAPSSPATLRSSRDASNHCLPCAMN
ncbi:MAG: hypothetical protein H0X40_12160 [Chthoniobacterales bacterium]|nr:hypothetical protein [Chthoniobacterales bacterium]